MEIRVWPATAGTQAYAGNRSPTLAGPPLAGRNTRHARSRGRALNGNTIARILAGRRSEPFFASAAI